MSDRTANMLGALGLMISDQIEVVARLVLKHVGETPAAVVVIGYGLGPSNNRLRDILGLSHPGTVRVVDRLVEDGLVERRKGKDARAIALYLTEDGIALRENLLHHRLVSIKTLLEPLALSEQQTLDALLHKMLSGLEMDDVEKCRSCRLCDRQICINCPIPADFTKV